MNTIFVHRNGQDRAGDEHRSRLARLRRPASSSGSISRRRPLSKSLILSDTFQFHPLSVEDAMAARAVPEGRSLRRLSLHRPARHRLPATASTASRRTTSTSSSGPNYLVTVHDGHSRVDRRAARPRDAQPEDAGRRRRSRCFTASSTRWSTTTGPRSTSWRTGSTSSRTQIFDDPEAGARPPRFSTKSGRSRSLRRIVTPQRDVIARLARRDFVDISTEMSFRFRDVYDHLVRIADDALIFQDRITGHARRAPVQRQQPAERGHEGADGRVDRSSCR